MEYVGEDFVLEVAAVSKLEEVIPAHQEVLWSLVLKVREYVSALEKERLIALLLEYADVFFCKQ